MAANRSSWMNEDLDALRDMTRAFMAKELVPNIDKYREQHHVDRDLWNKAGEVGLLCIS
ncbi:acyl-CoA dehydrogenase family protein, partial [Nocardia sp. NPDC060220]